MAPPALPDFIGHAAQLQSLKEDADTGNVAHAYLFAGPPRVGKMAAARWFAAELLLQGVPEGDRAETEGRIERLIHQDLLVLDKLWIAEQSEDWDDIARYSNLPQEHRSKGERVMRTDTIGIEDVRVLQDRFYATGAGRWRVCIIRGVERMQDEAANALLKILEEPPPGRVFLLTTQSLDSLLPTVVSRSRVLRFARVPEKEMTPLLKDVPQEEAGFLLHLAQGAPGVLKSLLDDPETLREEKILHAAALGFWTALTLAERLRLLEPLWKRGPDADRFLLHLALTLQECHVSKRAAWGRALLDLCRDLETNAQRQLLTSRFAFAVDEAALSPSADVR